MKKIILIFLLINTSGLLKAQGNLQFNRVINETILFDSFNANNEQEILDAITVPSGKVWKITYIVPNQTNYTDPTLIFPYNMSNGKFFYRKSGQPSYSFLFESNTATEGSNILWLGEGSYDFGCNGASPAAYNYHINIAGIEFNVLP